MKQFLQQALNRGCISLNSTSAFFNLSRKIITITVNTTSSLSALHSHHQKSGLFSLNWPNLPQTLNYELLTKEQPRRHRSLVLLSPSASSSTTDTQPKGFQFGKELRRTNESLDKSFKEKKTKRIPRFPFPTVDNNASSTSQPKDLNNPGHKDLRESLPNIPNISTIPNTSSKLFKQAPSATSSLFHQFPIKTTQLDSPSLTKGIGIGALSTQSQCGNSDSQPTVDQPYTFEHQEEQVQQDQIDQQVQLAAFLMRQRMPAMFARQLNLFSGAGLAGRLAGHHGWIPNYCALQQQQFFSFSSTPSSPTTSSFYDGDSAPLSPLPQKFPPVVNNLGL